MLLLYSPPPPLLTAEHAHTNHQQTAQLYAVCGSACLLSRKGPIPIFSSHAITFLRISSRMKVFLHFFSINESNYIKKEF